ncbi:MOSC and FAD-binding oxidoreductase domain-containing protein [Actinomadura sp. WMMA1423]|uniref:MOSC and FAD-binding oxidoreductase domain-containing protein n=1 Tax=Actinomadura sp. WMMA1423 TaxID=2591108 RepID=UPI00197A7F7A|nr:MOSC and FAD-binding oxidoreductase domain-containing protein [Actinomadura sp. WMMA1423]
MPRDVSWEGRTVRTGIWKEPVRGPVMARRLNLDGDGQGDLAGHGGEQRAVMVYQTDSYRYWERVLGRDDLVHGHFGENFTVEGLPDDRVCIGDRYRIGEAVFEVTQPRVTCYRVGMRLGEPRMAALLVAHRRPGFYMRVITEGTVEAGQEIVKVADGPGAMSVAEVDGLLYLSEHPRDRLESALRVQALSPGWQESFRALLRQGDGGPGGNAGLTAEATAPPPAWTGFRPLRVARIERESRSIVSVWLAAERGDALPPALPGQFVTVRLDADDHGPALVRSYSLSGRPGDRRYRISVKAEPHGAASTRLHRYLRVGDTLQVAAPRGTFVLPPGDGPVALVSAGVGATPVLAMLQALAESGTTRRVWWLHGARDGSEHAFAAEVRTLLDGLPHADLRVCYSRPRPQDRLGADYTDPGHLDALLLESAGVPADSDAYVCGPPSFMAAQTRALGERGLAADRIHTETFGAGPSVTPGVTASTARPPHPPAGPPGAGPEVSFARSGIRAPWDEHGSSLLEFAESCDVPVRWSCRTGVCHTCETAMLSGEVDYAPEPVAPPADGNVLICCARPTQETVLDL